MVVAFFLAGVPVYRLTRPAADSVSNANAVGLPSEPPGTKPIPLDVEATFAPAPTDFGIKNLAQTVLDGHGPQSKFHTRWTASVPAEGVDLVIQAHWPALVAGETSTGTAPGMNPAAVRVTIRFVDGRVVEKTFWSAANGALEEVFTLPGTAAPVSVP